MKTPLYIIAGLLVLGIIATAAFAFGGNNGNNPLKNTLAAGDYTAYSKEMQSAGKTPLNEDQFTAQSADHQAMQQTKQKIKTAIENNDYQAWKDAITATLTQERFNNLVSRRTTMQETQTKIDAAISANDYTAWADAIAGTPSEKQLSRAITADNFGTYVQYYTALKAKDMTTAQSLAKELGLPNRGVGMMNRFDHGMKEGRGMHDGWKEQ